MTDKQYIAITLLLLTIADTVAERLNPIIRILLFLIIIAGIKGDRQ